MKIIITGAAGFIGSNLTKKLLNDGHNVVGIDNLSYGEERNITDFKNHSKFSFQNGDICNPLFLKDTKADVLVHLASQKIPRYDNALKTLEENNLMLKNVISKCLSENMKLVFASTSDVYGKNPNLPFTEESDLVLGPTNVKRWAYALSKAYGEHSIIANNEQFGLNYTITRFFGSYGPNHNLTWWGGPQSGFISKAFNNQEIEIHGNGLQTRTFTYIKDTVEALSHCILDEKALNEIFNIGSFADEEVSIVDLAKLIWSLVNGENSSPKLKFIPYSSFGKYEDVMRRVPSIKKLQDYFEFNPKYRLSDGLKETILWQKKILSNK
jgi:UDP-glucose 4-epimerase